MGGTLGADRLLQLDLLGLPGSRSLLLEWWLCKVHG